MVLLQTKSNFKIILKCLSRRAYLHIYIIMLKSSAISKSANRLQCHYYLRYTTAVFLRKAKCKDVRIEPALITVQPSSFSRKTNSQDEGRIDVAAVWLYAPFERTFFDIRVTNPYCATNTFKPLDKIYRDHEKEKRDLYEKRVRQPKKGSFVPLVKGDRFELYL